MILSIGDLLLGKIPASVTDIAGKKKGRGRPRKIVDVDGIYVHKKADLKSVRKPLTPQVKYQIRHRFSELGINEPRAGTVWRISKIANEFKLTYAQVYELVI